MKHLHRPHLQLQDALNLRRRRLRVQNSGLAGRSLRTYARGEWKKYRQHPDATGVLSELERMAGYRERCMYCQDSLSAEVEHYMPIAEDPNSAFVWGNLLWICGRCNRKKLDKFPRTPSGLPLLIDPTQRDPWLHLFMDSGTGVITPKYDASSGLEDPFGLATLEVISVLGHEAVIEGRLQTINRLRRAARRFLASGNRSDATDLHREIHEDAFGVARWFLVYEGRGESTWTELRMQHPRLWRRAVSRSMR